MELFYCCVWKVLVAQSCPPFVTPWTVACQAPLPMEFSRQEYWSGLTFPSPGDLPDLGIKPRSPAWQVDCLPAESSGKPFNCCVEIQITVEDRYGGWDPKVWMVSDFSYCLLALNPHFFILLGDSGAVAIPTIFLFCQLALCYALLTENSRERL